MAVHKREAEGLTTVRRVDGGFSEGLTSDLGLRDDGLHQVGEEWQLAMG